MGRKTSYRYLILLLLLIPIMAETLGQLKADFDPKAQCFRAGDSGKYCFSALYQSLRGGLLVAPKWYRNKSVRPALSTGLLLLGEIHT